MQPIDYNEIKIIRSNGIDREREFTSFYCENVHSYTHCIHLIAFFSGLFLQKCIIFNEQFFVQFYTLFLEI